MFKKPAHQALWPKAPSGTRRGSALVGVLIALVVLSLIGASLHGVVSTGLKLGEHNLVYRQLALPCESGLDIATSELRRAGLFDDATPAEAKAALLAAGWATNATGISKSLGEQTVENGVKASVKIFVSRIDSSEPSVFAEATVLNGESTGVSRQMIAVFAKKSTGTPLRGLIARRALHSSGKLQSDSYRSSVGEYDSALRRDKTTVGSVSKDAADLVLGAFTEVFGNVRFGGETDQITGVNDSGHVWTTESASDFAANGVDRSAVSGDMTMDFPLVSAPDNTHAPVLSIDHKGKLLMDGSEVPGGELADGVYRVSSEFNISEKTDMKIVGEVTIVVDDSPWGPSFAPRVQVSGNSLIQIVDNAATSTAGKLKIYTPGSVNWSGNVVANSPPPSRLAIIGTAKETETPTQQINLSGNTDFTGVIYAPNAVLNFSGNTTVFGAVVGSRVFTSGNTFVHYDEDLVSPIEPNKVKLIVLTELIGDEKISLN